MNKQAVFKEYLKALYDTVPDILVRHAAPRPVTFRIMASDTQQVLSGLRNEGFSITETPLPGFYTASAKGIKISESRSFNSGHVYIQNVSSALPVLALQPSHGETLLDLCAAPGSKTTHSAQLMGRGEIVAVEKQSVRFYKLKEVLHKHSASWVTPYLADGTWLTKKYPQFTRYFDKVLVDVPCSNEANIDWDYATSIKYWHPRKGKELSGTQKRLLASALQAVKPDGVVVYSTCTYNPVENELVVHWARTKFPEWHVQKVSLNYPELETIPGFTHWKNKDLDNELPNCVRVLPNKWFSGFFVAVLKRN